MPDDMAWVSATLAKYFAPVESAMGRFLPEREPATYLYDLIRDYPSRDAKGLRPALLVSTCEAYGGTQDDAIEAAVSIELLHNALLVHDDIEDGSVLRRGAPALHHLAGIPLAINAGDALAMFALQPLHLAVERHGSRVGRLLIDEFHRMTRYSLEGQALELGWTRDNVLDLDDDDYMRLIMMKTCWYTTVYPLRVGAIIGSLGNCALEPLVTFGYYLGAAFQIQDDLLNLEGDEGEYGKELLGDLLEGKRTLPLTHLYRSANPRIKNELTELMSLSRDERTESAARWIRDQMTDHGSIEYTREFAAGIAASADEAFAAAFERLPPSQGKRFIELLVPYMLERRR